MFPFYIDKLHLKVIFNECFIFVSQASKLRVRVHLLKVRSLQTVVVNVRLSLLLSLLDVLEDRKPIVFSCSISDDNDYTTFILTYH